MSSIWGEKPSVGTTYPTCLANPITRMHIAQYAGASGDYNLVHTDEAFATGARYPSVIAHGMLTMGLTATFVTQLVGHSALRRFGGRFLAPVLPGDRLTAVATVVEAVWSSGSGRVLLRIVATRNDAVDVLDAYAEALIAR
ncbi:MAG: acyl dehydratase [Microbacteriaceae bacterium]|nr:MAG: acyl dehydratase [Microbacteriaceae bacterium]